jgi:hypothetical protein
MDFGGRRSIHEVGGYEIMNEKLLPGTLLAAGGVGLAIAAGPEFATQATALAAPFAGLSYQFGQRTAEHRRILTHEQRY